VALILCVGLDPFLVDLVSRLAPDHHVEAVDGVTETLLRRKPGAVLISADHPAAAVLPRTRLAPRTIAIIEPGRTVADPGHVGPILTRPVGVSDLTTALGGVLPGTRGERVRRFVRRLPDSATAEGIFAAARLAAAAAGVALELVTVGDAVHNGFLVAVAVLVVARMWIRGLSPALVSLDLSVVTATAIAAGNPRSSFLLLAAVVAAEVGYSFRAPTSVFVIGAATAAGIAAQIPLLDGGTQTVGDIAIWTSLLPLSALAGQLGWRIRRGTDRSSIELLNELQRTLERLLRQAQGVAGALEVGTVAQEVLRTAQEDLDAIAGIVLVGDPAVRSVVDSFGLVAPVPPRISVVDAGDNGASVPTVLRDALPIGPLMSVPLRTSDVSVGALIVVLPEDAPTGRQAQSVLRRLADEAGVALNNVQLFDRIREMSVDRERQRLARDLHDGVIQTLVHVGFELDFLGRSSPPPELAEQIARLRQIVGQTVEEVRATVNDLRSPRLAEGLGRALDSLVRELTVQDGPRIQVIADPVPDLAPEAQLQLYRLTQEALSNALQHARCKNVLVRMRHRDGHLRLEILDDGIGVGSGAPSGDGRGVGLRAMAERARLLGGQLTVDDRPDGGTAVVVDVGFDVVGVR
jgi:signal transduction histidine kinase